MTATECIAPEFVIVVDANNNEIDQAEKLLAHQQNLLHRAFSAFVFRGQELLLQQRALHKYHSAGLWTNTCCSHPRPGEEVVAAGERRLKEEFGLSVALSDLGWFHYNAHFSNGLSENELDHVLMGELNQDAGVKPNPQEIKDYRWLSIPELEQQMAKQPECFTPWLAKALSKIILARKQHGTDIPKRAINAI